MPEGTPPDRDARNARKGDASASPSEILLREQNRILEGMARGGDPQTSLEAIVRFVETRLPHVRPSILLLDRDGLHLRHAVAPSLPAAYLDGTRVVPVGPEEGSCGTAAYLRQEVLSEDIARDGRWVRGRDLALSHGLRACWALPLFDPGGRVLGTFALYYAEPRTPTSEEREYARVAVHLAELALDRMRKAEALAESDGRYRTLFHSIDEGFCILQMRFDDDGRPIDYLFLETNPTFERHTGLKGALGRTARELVPDLDESWFETYGRVALTGESTRFSNQAPAMGRWFDTFAFRIGEPEDRLVALLFKDVTKEKAAEEALRESERRHRSMSDFRRSVMHLAEDVLEATTADAFYARTLQEAVQVIPGVQAGSLLLRTGPDEFRFESVVGYDLEPLRRAVLPEVTAGFGHIRRDLQPLVVRHPEPDPTLPEETRAILADVGRHHEIQAVLVVPIVVDDVLTAFLTLDNFDDPDVFTNESIEMARVFGGHVASLVKRFALEEELHRLAFRDPLTNLPNRALFAEHLERTLARPHKEGTKTAVMFVDLDNLKPINDSLGHPTGDEVLRVVAARLAPLAGPRALVARVGGDEFTVVLTARHAERAARQLAERILSALSAPIRAGEHELHISASVGIALHPEDGVRGEDLLRHADIAMYHAKQGGKNDYALFRSEMEAAPLERLLLEEALRTALEEDRFVLHFQPRIDLSTGAVSCVEALVRWDHPERGTVPPSLFVPLAETTNLIHPLGRRILEMAVRQAKRWRDEGLTDLRVSVNLSARQLDRSDFVDEVRAILASTGLPPSALEFEVLESVAMADLAVSLEKLASLKALGVSIALDDFGIGYSSLAYLRDLPVDTIKIDRTFLDDLVDGSHPVQALAIVRAITELGKSLGLTVVAEGVESSAQLEALRRVGCHEVQGNVLSPPRAAEDLTGLLARSVTR